MIADKNCSGCGLCSLACPKKAIKMIEDQKGFYYPKINISSCVDCKLCTKLCSKIENKNTVKEAYILRHINETIFSRSQSGGAF
nr:4Fe-4S dicluster domain-containing protein [Acholeplasmatales bacterium]